MEEIGFEILIQEVRVWRQENNSQMVASDTTQLAADWVWANMYL